jgi:hypothetical protein
MLLEQTGHGVLEPREAALEFAEAIFQALGLCHGEGSRS